MTGAGGFAIARFLAVFVMAVCLSVPAQAGARSAAQAAEVEIAASIRNASNAQIHFLRGGFAGVFSTGLDDIAKELRKKGVSAHVTSWSSSGSVTRRIRKAYASDQRGGPVILAGHSLGAGAVIDIAEELTAAGIEVDLLIVFDTLGAPPVPKGVKKFISFKASGNKKVAGSFKGAPGFRGKIVNIDIRTLPGLDDSSHWNMVGKKDLQDRVMKEIESALRRWKPKRRS